MSVTVGVVGIALALAAGATLMFITSHSEASQKMARLQQAVKSQSFATSVATNQPILTEPEVLGTSTEEAFVATSTEQPAAVEEPAVPQPAPQPAGPELTSLSSQNAAAGATITIHGKDLVGAQAYLSVGGQVVPLATSGSDSALQFSVPQQVPAGHYKLFVTQHGATAGPLDFFVK